MIEIFQRIKAILLE